MADTDIPFPLTLGKLETQTLGGVSNLKFFCMIDINKKVVIFQFFHNDRCCYSVSIQTRKTGDPNFGRGRLFEIFLYDQYLQNGSHVSIFS